MTDGPKNALPAGHVVDKYRIGDVLGAGGFGIVYRGKHQELGLDVAIKEYLPPEIAVRDGTSVQPLSSDSRENYDEGLRRFLEEAKRLVQFNHPNVARCRDFFRANGTAYLVMDFEDGLPLSELLRQREEQDNPLSGDEIKQIILPLLDGLKVVHAHDVLHRDIKPGNIFIRRSTEQPVLIDFGAAKQGFSEHSKSVWAYTQGYAPPEQIEQDGKLGPWTDIYAIGAVMWRIVSGDNPPSAEDRMFAQARGNPDPMKPAAELSAEKYPSALLQAIDMCLSPQEKDRYQSAAALSQALRKAKQQSTRKPMPGKKALRATGIGMATAALIAALIASIRLLPPIAPDGEASNPVASAQSAPANALSPAADAEDASGNVPWLRIGADQGHAESQYVLGIFYHNGIDVPQNHAEAARLFRLAAEQGHAEAQTMLGVLYYRGKGVPEDKREAARWLRLAAEQGDADAQTRLGVLYILGEGVPEDRREAVRWLRLAAEQGDAEAQARLGGAYALGKGVAQDYREAYIWLSIAVGSGEENAANARDAAAGELPPAALLAAQNEARRRLEAISQSR